MAKSGKKSVKNTHAKQQEDISSEIENIGDYLRTIRTKKGLSITDVSETTRISETNIKALENQDFTALPADTFTRGLLKIYAKFLGEDPAHIVAPFMEKRNAGQIQGKRIRPILTKRVLTPKRLAEPVQVSSISMAGILLLVIVILFTGFGFYTSWDPFNFFFKETDKLSDVANTIPDTSPILADQSIVLPTETVNDAQETYVLTIRFLADTQIEIIRNNDEPVSRIYSRGNEQTWDAASSIQITFDKPESGTILVNNTPVDFPAGHNGLFTLRIPEDLPTPRAND